MGPSCTNGMFCNTSHFLHVNMLLTYNFFYRCRFIIKHKISYYCLNATENRDLNCFFFFDKV